MFWANHSQGWPEGSLSWAITPRCRRGCYSFAWIALIIFDPCLIMLSIKQGGTKYHFFNLWYDLTWDWIPVSWTIDEHLNICVINLPNLKLEINNLSLNVVYCKNACNDACVPWNFQRELCACVWLYWMAFKLLCNNLTFRK